MTWILKNRRVAGGYLLLQAGSVVAWWIVLATTPAARGLFRPAHFPDDALLAFWLADLSCVAGGSLVGGLRLVRGRPSPMALPFTAGALVFASLYCITLVAMTGDAAAAAALMTPAALITVTITRACAGQTGGEP